MTLHHEMSCNVPDGHFHVFIFSESKFYAIYSDEIHFQIRGLVAEVHVFEYGDMTFGTFRKTCFKCWRLLCKNSRVGLKNYVFDHEKRKSGLFPCYRLKINDFLSGYNQNIKIDILTPLQQIPCYCKSRLGTLRLISWWRVPYVHGVLNWSKGKWICLILFVQTHACICFTSLAY